MPSLQDQLLKAGIADKKKLKKIAADKRRETAELRKQQPSKKKRDKTPVLTEAQIAAQQAEKQKIERDRELNRQKNLEAQAKALRAQIIQLVNMNTIKRDKGDVAYRFENSGATDTIYVTAKQKQQLSNGQLAITELNNEYQLIPAAVADKIKTRDASVIISHHDKIETDENDPYAEFQIPDDFDW